MKFLMTYFSIFSVVICLSSTVQGHVIKKHTKLILDHDGGADDAMAIFIALLRETYFRGPELIAISTVHGNVNESQAFVNTQRILDVAGRQNVPIYRGSSNALITDYPQDHFFGNDGLGDNAAVKHYGIAEQPLHSVMALLELSKMFEGEIILVAIGPLTNIALAIKLDPQFIGRLKHLYIGGSNVNSSSFLKPEFNNQLDVEAYYIVTKNANIDKVTVVPFSEMLKSMSISADWRLKELGSINTNIMKAQNQFEAVSLPKSKKWEFLDPIVMSIALDSNVVQKKVYSKNNITLNGPSRGINMNDFTSSEPNINLVTAGAEEYYKKFLMETFSAELYQYNYINKLMVPRVFIKF